jgi:hypothetical protein
MSTTEAANAAHLYEWATSRPEFDALCAHEESPGRVKGLPCRDRTDFLRCAVDSARLASVEAS